MKVTITLKDPDGVCNSIQKAVRGSLAEFQDAMDAEELESMEEARMETTQEKLGKWIEYGEYIRVEFDTDAGTATVMPVAK